MVSLLIIFLNEIPLECSGLLKGEKKDNTVSLHFISVSLFVQPFYVLKTDQFYFLYFSYFPYYYFLSNLKDNFNESSLFHTELPAKSDNQRRIKLSVDSRKGFPLAGLSNYRGLRIAE